MNKSLTELQELHAKLSFDFNIERLKTTSLEKDRNIFRSSCRKTANQGVSRLNLEIANLKDSLKTQQKSKQSLLQAKDMKYKDTLVHYRQNLRDNKKQLATIESLNKTHNKHVGTISELNGDIMAKIRECDIFKKENKTLASQVKAFERKSNSFDERKMEHELELKKIALKTEEMKVQSIEKTTVLKEKTHQQDHKRKLHGISFLAKARQRGKDNDEKRKNLAKQKKFQGGSDQMGLLLGEIRKQTDVNGGCVPNPGTTPIPLVRVSFRFVVCLVLLLYHCSNYNPFFAYTTYINR
jgi:hypothetical protein